MLSYEVYTMKKLYLNKSGPDWRNNADWQIHVFPIQNTWTIFLYSHLALRHLVNTKLRVSQTIEMARSDAAVRKASKENIVKKVKSLAWH